VPTRQRVMLKFQELIRANWVRAHFSPAAVEKQEGSYSSRQGKQPCRAFSCLGASPCIRSLQNS